MSQAPFYPEDEKEDIDTYVNEVDSDDDSTVSITALVAEGTSHPTSTKRQHQLT